MTDIKPCTVDELLEAVTPVYPAANILTNFELGLDSFFDEAYQLLCDDIASENS